LPRVSSHVLVLTDRDWTHPQGGGTGTHLYGLVSRWLDWGHRVTIVSAGYPGALAVEQPAPGLELHHLGDRLTVFPRAARALRRGLAADADVVLEIINGIAFFTPLWPLRRPRVAFVHHVHRDMYVEELGRRGAIAAWLLEALPLRHLYGGTPFVTVSESARAGLVDLGLDPERVTVVHNGVEADAFEPAERAATPTLVYLGRLKRYKRLEILLDVVEALPDVHLDVAGEGDHRPALEREIAARGLGARVTLHGHVDEARKRELLARAWVNLTASSAEGWCLVVMEAAAVGTPSAALAVGGLTESIVDGRTGVLAQDGPELTAAVRALLADSERRERLGVAARARAATFTWERAATRVMGVLEETAGRTPEPLRVTLRRRLAGPPGVAAATLLASAGSLVLTMILARALGAGGFGALAALTAVLLALAVPAPRCSSGRRARWPRERSGRRPTSPARCDAGGESFWPRRRSALPARSWGATRSPAWPACPSRGRRRASCRRPCCGWACSCTAAPCRAPARTAAWQRVCSWRRPSAWPRPGRSWPPARGSPAPCSRSWPRWASRWSCSRRPLAARSALRRRPRGGCCAGAWPVRGSRWRG
jgi:glycosyltransferase involved in cell wall biosynthesis